MKYFTMRFSFENGDYEYVKVVAKNALIAIAWAEKEGHDSKNLDYLNAEPVATAE